jgi:hypothetical protein
MRDDANAADGSAVVDPTLWQTNTNMSAKNEPIHTNTLPKLLMCKNFPNGKSASKYSLITCSGYVPVQQLVPQT